jgi:hypothetical protein
MQSRLQRRIEDRVENRERMIRNNAEYNAHIKAINEAMDEVQIDFWCEGCGKDFTSNGYKTIGKLGRWPVAWYVGLCPKGHKCLRRITDKGNDVYYYRSKMVQLQRILSSDDIITPDNPRFKLIYPDKWRELYGEKRWGS